MRLHNLVKSEGSRRPKKRLGRGHGSGHGKTSGRGHNGQKSRSGASQRPGFESGHIPLYRKLPKRGFNNFNFRTDYSIVNLTSLEKLDASITEVTKEVLVKAGVVRSNASLIKILGDGEITRALKISANKFSASAKEKIEKAGGETIVVELPKEEAPSEESK
jgi:large subunit ribosomal protein L15